METKKITSDEYRNKLYLVDDCTSFLSGLLDLYKKYEGSIASFPHLESLRLASRALCEAIDSFVEVRNDFVNNRKG